MCTVTWWTSTNGYELYFNRDELKSRLSAIPPQLEVLDDVRYLSPRDGDAGGTWLLVNEYGLTIGLINEYPLTRANVAVPSVSRGRLVRTLANCRSVSELLDRLEQLDLSLYKPFRILGIEPGNSDISLLWNGFTLETAADASSMLPFTSSSYLSDEVARYRRSLFFWMLAVKGQLSRAGLREYHHQHDPAAAPHSVLMRRSDAETVSFTHVKVDSSQISMFYAQKGSQHSAFSRPHTTAISRVQCTT